MKRIIYFITLFMLSLGVNSQNEQTLITINDTKISAAEFERIYNKNNNNLYNKSDKKSPEEYIDLYIDFKLKVLEAQRLKMDTNSVFVNEFNQYRKELAAPYLTDVKFNKQLVKELYDRMTKEVNASHILLRLEKNASKTEENAVLEKIREIKNEIESGKDFAEAAVEYSEDPSAKTNKGNLNYFSAFQMVAPFENAAFTTPKGEVSEPVRSAFGYHILKVHDIRKNRGQIQVAHIMKSFPQNATPEIKEKIKNDIYDIYIELQNGANFEELAKSKSDDRKSASKGGEMPWFAAGRMIKEFSEPAFALKNTGDYTPPVLSQFGYHIIKKLDHRPIDSFNKLEKEIENRIKKDPERSITSKIVFFNKLKKEYNFVLKTYELQQLEDIEIKDNPSFNNFVIFTLAGKDYDFDSYKKYLHENDIKNGTYSSHLDLWIENEITAYENSRLEEKYPEFRFLINEYHDGILMFNISEEKIWNFASEDSVGLEKFYQKHNKKYLWEERFKGSIVVCKDKETRNEAEKYFSANMTREEILDQINDKEEKITIEEGAWEMGNNPVVDYFVWNKEEPADFKSELTFIRGDKIGPEPKSLEEAKGLYISDYQKKIEEDWLKVLRKKYKIKINKKLLKTIEGV